MFWQRLESFSLCFGLQFEYQQAQLEVEIENLSWKIEHAETTDRGDLENQIDIAEKRRTSLLKDFLPSWQLLCKKWTLTGRAQKHQQLKQNGTKMLF